MSTHAGMMLQPCSPFTLTDFIVCLTSRPVSERMKGIPVRPGTLIPVQLLDVRLQLWSTTQHCLTTDTTKPFFIQVPPHANADGVSETSAQNASYHNLTGMLSPVGGNKKQLFTVYDENTSLVQRFSTVPIVRIGRAGMLVGI